jgi:predicted ATPase
MIEVSALSGMRKSHVLEPYINHIRFPHFKNLEDGTRIDFDFPITALVGPNGTNKSSVLNALFGTSGMNNLGTRWFSTRVDPIDEAGGRPRFIYGFWNQRTQQIVEVMKTRIRKAENPDYWEPSRPILSDGMAPLPKLGPNETYPDRSKTRWNTIDKTVVHIDFRSELSAFDQYFYFGDLHRSTRVNTKQDFIRSKSVYLRRIIDERLRTLPLWSKERVFNNTLLSQEQLEIASKILGVNYSKVRVIEHSLFGRRGSSAILTTQNLSYSEAFAGSGEFAIVMLVKKITEAPERSLILLDEPEVSLHPGAQKRLLQFLVESVKKKKHQIVMGTHSPTLVRDLPPEAIKVFRRDPISQKFSVLDKASPAEAFFHLGEPLPNKLRVLAEDALAVQVIKTAIRHETEAIRQQIEVSFFPGGAESLIKQYMRTFVTENRVDTLVFLDGDKEKAKMRDPDSVSPNEEGKLDEMIKQATGIDLPMIVDGGAGGGNVVQKVQFEKNFMRWYRKYVRFLPSTCPEEFIWEASPSDGAKENLASRGFKQRFVELAKAGLGFNEDEQVDSEQILVFQMQMLAKVPEGDAGIAKVRDEIITHLQGMSEQ